MNVLTNLNI